MQTARPLALPRLRLYRTHCAAHASQEPLPSGSPCWREASCCTGVVWPAQDPLPPFRLAGGGPGRGAGMDAPTEGVLVGMPDGRRCMAAVARGVGASAGGAGGSAGGATAATGRGWPVARQWAAVCRLHQPLAALCGLTCGTMAAWAAAGHDNLAGHSDAPCRLHAGMFGIHSSTAADQAPATLPAPLFFPPAHLHARLQVALCNPVLQLLH